MALEEEGRRRQVVVVTDRRVLITGLRGETSVDFPLDGSTCHYQRAGGRLTFGHEDRELTVREIDGLAGRNIQTLLEARATRRIARDAV
jgi:hypothetical protein